MSVRLAGTGSRAVPEFRVQGGAYVVRLTCDPGSPDVRVTAVGARGGTTPFSCTIPTHGTVVTDDRRERLRVLARPGQRWSLLVTQCVADDCSVRARTTWSGAADF